MSNEIILNAYGKINLGLDVTGRREDGYHLVKMVMQTVDIKDVITVKKLDKTGNPEGIMISSDDPKCPADSSNIAWKAAKLLTDLYDCGPVSIHIEKNIPIEAGMAGGSTDAAAVLLAMNELFKLNLSDGELDRLALKLGADVPFCLRKGTYLAEGIGEILTPLKEAPYAGVVIVKPDFGMSTPYVYKKLDELKDPKHPDMDGIIESIWEQDLEKLAEKLGNILELVTEAENPIITQIKEHMVRMGAAASLMTGSGPTVFGLYKDDAAAEKAAEFFKDHKEYGRCILTHFIRQEQTC